MQPATQVCRHTNAVATTKPQCVHSGGVATQSMKFRSILINSLRTSKVLCGAEGSKQASNGAVAHPQTAKGVIAAVMYNIRLEESIGHRNVHDRTHSFADKLEEQLLFLSSQGFLRQEHWRSFSHKYSHASSVSRKELLKAVKRELISVPVSEPLPLPCSEATSGDPCPSTPAFAHTSPATSAAPRVPSSPRTPTPAFQHLSPASTPALTEPSSPQPSSLASQPAQTDASTSRSTAVFNTAAPVAHQDNTPSTSSTQAINNADRASMPLAPASSLQTSTQRDMLSGAADSEAGGSAVDSHANGWMDRQTDRRSDRRADWGALNRPPEHLKPSYAPRKGARRRNTPAAGGAAAMAAVQQHEEHPRTPPFSPQAVGSSGSEWRAVSRHQSPQARRLAAHAQSFLFQTALLRGSDTPPGTANTSPDVPATKPFMLPPVTTQLPHSDGRSAMLPQPPILPATDAAAQERTLLDAAASRPEFATHEDSFGNAADSQTMAVQLTGSTGKGHSHERLARLFPSWNTEFGGAHSQVTAEQLEHMASVEYRRPVETLLLPGQFDWKCGRYHFLFFDFETTGLYPATEHVTEVAVYCPGTGRGFSTLAYLPGVCVPHFIAEKTGISTAMVQDAKLPPVRLWCAAFVKLVEEHHGANGVAVLAAHNGNSFDFKWLADKLTSVGMSLPSGVMALDTLLMARKWMAVKEPGVKQSAGMDVLRKKFKLPADNAHRAEADVIAMLRVSSLMVPDLLPRGKKDVQDRMEAWLRNRPAYIRRMEDYLPQVYDPDDPAVIMVSPWNPSQLPRAAPTPAAAALLDATLSTSDNGASVAVSEALHALQQVGSLQEATASGVARRHQDSQAHELEELLGGVGQLLAKLRGTTEERAAARMEDEFFEFPEPIAELEQHWDAAIEMAAESAQRTDLLTLPLVSLGAVKDETDPLRQQIRQLFGRSLNKLRELGFWTLGDLMQHYPKEYSFFKPLHCLTAPPTPGQHLAFTGTVQKSGTARSKQRFSGYHILEIGVHMPPPGTTAWPKPLDAESAPTPDADGAEPEGEHSAGLPLEAFLTTSRLSASGAGTGPGPHHRHLAGPVRELETCEGTGTHPIFSAQELLGNPIKDLRKHRDQQVANLARVLPSKCNKVTFKPYIQSVWRDNSDGLQVGAPVFVQGRLSQPTTKNPQVISGELMRMDSTTQVVPMMEPRGLAGARALLTGEPLLLPRWPQKGTIDADKFESMLVPLSNLLHTHAIAEKERLAGATKPKRGRKKADAAVPAPLVTGAVKGALIDWQMGLQQLHGVEAAAGAVPPTLTVPALTLAWKVAHNPVSPVEAESARRVLAFNEVLQLQLAALLRRDILRQPKRPQDQRSMALEQFLLMDEMTNALPFKLTSAQNQALQEIVDDLMGETPMMRLLQGDVGCGKTAVAFLAIAAMVGSGFQCALMVPTGVLADQHTRNLEKLAQEMQKRRRGRARAESTYELRLERYDRGLTAKQARAARERIANGEVNVVIGTHKLLYDVQWKRLGLVVIDEQHKFGVAQRRKISESFSPVPHVLSMSATPIPRTVALVDRGDMDHSIIRQLPAGRLPITTAVLYDSEGSKAEVVDAIMQELDTGGQAYIVYPLIEDSDTERFADLQACDTAFKEFLDKKTFGKHRVGLLHGSMSQEERIGVITKFQRGRIKVLVATTVVEVGVDVPNASIMVIQHAERFGLAQLHQLRGRVGRSERLSTCYMLCSDGTSAFDRVRAMEDLATGWEVAEQDLVNRGEGDLAGTKQAGQIPRFKMFRPKVDEDLLLQARQLAQLLVDLYGVREPGKWPLPLLAAMNKLKMNTEVQPEKELQEMTTGSRSAEGREAA